MLHAYFLINVDQVVYVEQICPPGSGTLVRLETFLWVVGSGANVASQTRAYHYHNSIGERQTEIINEWINMCLPWSK